MNRRACIGLLLVLVVIVNSASPSHDSDEDFFRLKSQGDASSTANKKPAVVNPKKSALPVGTSALDGRNSHFRFEFVSTLNSDRLSRPLFSKTHRSIPVQTPSRTGCY